MSKQIEPKRPPMWIISATNSYRKEYPGDIWRDFIVLVLATLCWVLTIFFDRANLIWVSMMWVWIIGEVWNNRA